MFGLLNVNKPSGITSRDAVNRVQRIVRPVKVGHAGTLDPLANGVLVLCLGQATRLIEYVQRMRKTYRGEFLLGRSSDTEDIEGQVLELPDAPQPSREEIEELLPRFTGSIQQQPPAYSALKVGGRRAYDLARSGQAVELAPREVTIHELRLLDYDYPRMTLEVVCGGGTYIRSLGRDIAQAAGTAAVMSALTRKKTGPFDLAQAISLDDLSAESLPDALLPARLAVDGLPQVELTAEEMQHLVHGRTIPDRFGLKAREIAAFDSSQSLQAILVPHSRGLKPLRNFIAQT